MKKILGLLIALVGLITFNVKAAEITLPDVTDHEKVHIYLFYWNQCSHCHDFLAYFQKNYNDDYAKYFDIISFEVTNEDNSALSDKVRDALEVSEGGVPLIVWGDKYQVGFGTDGSDIIKQVLDLYQDPDYQDIVGGLIEEYKAEKENGEDDSTDNQTDLKQESFKEALITMGLERPDNAIPDWAIITIIFVVLIGGIGGLFFLARKK